MYSFRLYHADITKILFVHTLPKITMFEEKKRDRERNNSINDGKRSLLSINENAIQFAWMNISERSKWFNLLLKNKRVDQFSVLWKMNPKYFTELPNLPHSCLKLEPSKYCSSETKKKWQLLVTSGWISVCAKWGKRKK